MGRAERGGAGAGHATTGEGAASDFQGVEAEVPREVCPGKTERPTHQLGSGDVGRKSSVAEKGAPAAWTQAALLVPPPSEPEGVVPEERFTRSRSSLPVRKRSPRFGFTGMTWPVFGLRPW